MKVGIDVVAVARLDRLATEAPGALERIFTERELRRCTGRRAAERLAARYAAKEAVLKALGIGISGRLRLTDVEIVREPSGRPTVTLHGPLAGRGPVEVSLTHSEGMAMAVAVC